MKDLSLVYPMFAMVLLTFSTLVRLFRTRIRFVREGAVSASYFKTYQDGAELEASARLARHFVNLFEAPTLFYVALRCVHTYIHTGSNQLQHRIAAYFSSWAVLLLIWICIVTGVALAKA